MWDEQDIVDIDDIKFTPYILGIFEEDGVSSVAKLALDASCTLKVGYKYTDERNSFWDKEDNCLFVENRSGNGRKLFSST